MKQTIAIVLLTSFSAVAQVTEEDLKAKLKTLNSEIKTLSNENASLKSKVNSIESHLESTNKELQDIKTLVSSNHDSISHKAQLLEYTIESSTKDANNKIDNVDKSLSTNSLYGIIGVLSAILISGLLYWLLSKRQKTDKTDLIEQLSNTKSTIEESLVKEFGKQTGLMDAQLELIELQKANIKIDSNTEPDHSLALKLADEITLIERNISLMDSGTKGLKQLNRSVSNLKNNLAANGYDIPELLGKPLNRGMHTIPINTIPNENLDAGVEIISKIIKPQVNYNNKMIQASQIEVSVGF